jgi:hypothetical protein
MNLMSLPDPAAVERVDALFSHPGLRIERIVSWGQASPAGFWYDQAEGEWVLVLGGAARLRFEDETDARVRRDRGPGLGAVGDAEREPTVLVGSQVSDLLSALRFVLLVPHGVIEVDDTLAEGAAARGDTDIGAGQTRLLPSGLMGALDGIGALGATCGEQCGKGAD